MTDERLAWWGTCDNCGARIIVAPSADSNDPLPDTDDWESFGAFADCYVCDGQVNFGGADPVEEVLA